MSIRTSAASRRDDDTREACRLLPDDPLSIRMNIDHALVIGRGHISASNLHAALRMRRELVSQSVRRST